MLPRFSVTGTNMAIGFLSNAPLGKTGVPDMLSIIAIGITSSQVTAVFPYGKAWLVMPLFTALTVMKIQFVGALQNQDD